jgi:predicted unusual protein kinase regulating ubiquinone biosynthesis (AarF/ABC1/UbiB family)
MREYRDIIQEMPFQFQVDMLFVIRAVGILSGMSTNLDENFDPWAETIPFAERLAAEELQQNWRGWLQAFVALGQVLYKLPQQLERTLTQAHRGNLTVQTSLSPDARKQAQRLEQAINRLSWMVVATGLLISGVSLWAVAQDDYLGGVLLVLAVAAFLWGMLWKG